MHCKYINSDLCSDTEMLVSIQQTYSWIPCVHTFNDIVWPSLAVHIYQEYILYTICPMNADAKRKR